MKLMNVLSHRLTRDILSKFMLISFVLLPYSANAIGPENERHRPSHWAPNHVVSLLSNNAGWGNVAYWLQWTGPDSMDYLDAPRHNEGVLEVGWKNHGFDTCGDKPDGALGKGGYPADVKVQVDDTEDDGDAVLWITDLDLLRNDQRANPDRKYLAWWNCKGNDNFSVGNGINPHFQVQLAHWGREFICVVNPFKDKKQPACTKVDATLNYIAPGGVGLTTMPTNARPTRQVNMDQSWALDWNFESGDGRWGVGQASKQRIAGNANQGGHYLYIEPDNQGAANSWLTQSLRVRNVTDGEFLDIGKNTGTLQFEMAARCPAWSPGWALKNTNHCKISVWMKTPNDGNWNAAKHKKTWNINADGKWYYIMADNWEAQAADDQVSLQINTRGYPIDVDGIWVSSGLF